MSTPQSTFRDVSSTAPGDGREFLAPLRTRWRMVVLISVATLALSLAWSGLQTSKYTATAALYFRDPGFSQQLFGNTFVAPNEDPTRQAATNTELVGLDTVSRLTARALGGTATAGEVKSAVSIVPEGQSDVAKVEATDEDPKRAATIANTFAREFLALRKASNRASLTEALAVVQRQLSDAASTGADAATLRARASQLQILQSLQTANAELVQAALPPETPSSPRTKRNAAFGLVLGALLGAAFAYGLAKSDRRLRTPQAISDILGRPVLGTVPESRGLSSSHEDVPPTGPDGEAFRLMRASLRYFNLGTDIRSILITSASPGEGKTTVALNLARAAAHANERVLLIETDMRLPAIAGRLSPATTASRGSGLSGVLSGQTGLTDAIRVEPLGDIDSEGRSLSILPAGAQPPNPGDLLESARMRTLITEALGEFDLVILDTPPITVVPDAIPLISTVDGVVVVARLGRTTRQAMTDLREQLGNLGADVLGVVVNGGSRNQRYGYDYQYAAAPAFVPVKK